MEILIQGTKGGWKLLYPTAVTSEAMYRFASDTRRTDSKGNIRWQFYSIAFEAQGCIISKYVGVRDVLRQFGGYVAFSVNLSNSQKMSGNDIKLLLDDLAGRYCNDYVVGGNLGGDVHEDWTFVKAIESQYESKIRKVQSQDTFSVQSGTGEPAYIYYEGDAELCKFLDAPYQDEYSPFKQVFLLDKSFESSPESPLNALRHDPQANLTGKIDLENPWYKLVIRQNNSYQGVEVEVKSNGKKKNNDNKVYRKETLTITYSKKYCETRVLEGKITDAALQPYLEIDEDNRRITVKRDVDLRPASKKVMIVVTDLKGRSVEGVEVKVLSQGDNPIKKTPENDGGFVFVGEELGRTFTVTASKNDLNASSKFIPNNESIIQLTIQKRKRFEIFVRDEKNEQLNCDIKVEDKKSRAEKKAQSHSSYEFLEDEIERTFLITVSKTGYESRSHEFCPEKERRDSIVFVLKKKVKKPGMGKRYCLLVDPDKGHSLICQYIENINELSSYSPQAKKGYRFVDWNKDYCDQPYNGYDGCIIANFEETWWHKNKGKVLLAAIALVLVAMIIIVISLMRGKKQPEVNNDFSHVKDSIEQCGNDSVKLQQLHDRWTSYKPKIEQEGGFLGMGGTPNSTNYKAWENGLDEIQKAIEKSLDVKVTPGTDNPDNGCIFEFNETVTTPTPTNPSSESSSTSSSSTSSPGIKANNPANKQKELENEFWELVHNKASKSEFDTLFLQKGWDKNSAIWKFYNTYLSWGKSSYNMKNAEGDKYNYYKGFNMVKEIELRSCNDIKELTNLVKKELGI